MAREDHEDLKGLGTFIGHCVHCKKVVQQPCGSGYQATGCMNFPDQARREIEDLAKQTGLPSPLKPKPYVIPDLVPPKQSDAVNQPAHYARWKMQPIEFIAANDLPFWFANVIKYCARFDAKDGLQDLYKARSYLDMQIRKLEGEGRFWEKPVSEQQEKLNAKA